MRKVLGLGAALAILSVSGASAQDEALIAAGQEVFMTNCAVCHGADLTPLPGVFDLKTFRANQRDRFNRSVMQGVGDGMPPWEGIVSAEQLDQLWAFIQSK